MKLILALSFVAFALSASVERSPTFSLVSDRSDNGAPIIAVTFPNGHSDTLHLSHFDADARDCRFNGHLLSDPETCLAVTGCPGQEDVELTILSEHAPGSRVFKWNKDGSVENLENPMASSERRGFTDIIEPVASGFGSGILFTIEGKCKDGLCKAIPTTNKLSIRVGYDDNYKTKTGSDVKAKAYWAKALVHVQAYYCHSATLGAKIQISVASIKHYSGKKLTASEASEKTMNAITKTDLKGADLMVYLAHDSASKGPAGIASIGVVCDTRTTVQPMKQSISEWQQTVSTFAWIVAHEIGHNLGLGHDQSKNNGGDLGACNKNAGIMSYKEANKTKKPWSTCSKFSLKVWYNTILAMNMSWCMEAVTTNFCTTAYKPIGTTKATTKITTKATTKATATTKSTTAKPVTGMPNHG